MVSIAKHGRTQSRPRAHALEARCWKQGAQPCECGALCASMSSRRTEERPTPPTLAPASQQLPPSQSSPPHCRTELKPPLTTAQRRGPLAAPWSTWWPRPLPLLRLPPPRLRQRQRRLLLLLLRRLLPRAFAQSPPPICSSSLPAGTAARRQSARSSPQRPAQPPARRLPRRHGGRRPSAPSFRCAAGQAAPGVPPREPSPNARGPAARRDQANGSKVGDARKACARAECPRVEAGRPAYGRPLGLAPSHVRVTSGSHPNHTSAIRSESVGTDPDLARGRGT